MSGAWEGVDSQAVVTVEEWGRAAMDCPHGNAPWPCPTYKAAATALRDTATLGGAGVTRICPSCFGGARGCRTCGDKGEIT